MPRKPKMVRIAVGACRPFIWQVCLAGKWFTYNAEYQTRGWCVHVAHTWARREYGPDVVIEWE